VGVLPRPYSHRTELLLIVVINNLPRTDWPWEPPKKICDYTVPVRNGPIEPIERGPTDTWLLAKLVGHIPSIHSGELSVFERAS
jgi:hypothetical protein